MLSKGCRLAVCLLILHGPLPLRADEPFQRLGDWQPVFRGIDLLRLEARQPRLMHGYVLRIDLQAPGIRFLATPDNGDKPGHTDGLKTSTFLSRFGCQAAINAAPFSPIHAEEGLPQTISGLTISQGKEVSPPDPKFPALLIRKGLRVQIAAPPFDLTEVETAVAGFQIVLKNGQIITEGRDVHPRTAAGISSDGRYLFLLVIDGRQPGYSLGATTREIGEWLKALGASDGINLDGGGTTTLVLADPDGKPRIVNRPIHAGIPGRERVSASHLGVFADPLPKQP
ncbi:MAG: phosphodiester glycosidase family protein [Gemmatales bacterium]|nr:phosphodiester glycosidase family protein [Gemmatales bacterium]MDW8386916.1 phosphodiester glycosidase family protein [Gemmatales bacterium]